MPGRGAYKLSKNRGFTLIEVMMAILLVGIIMIPFFQFINFQFNFFNHLQDKIDFRQQIRVINIFLQKDLKKAVDVKLDDINGNGQKELLINLGEKEGYSSSTDYYLMYNVQDKRLTIKKPVSSFADSGINYPDWPAEEDWSFNRSLTLEIVEKYKFTQSSKGLITYLFEIKNQNNSYIIENQLVIPRLLNQQVD